MAKQKFRPTRPGGFSGTKAYIWYVEVLKKHRNAVGRNFFATPSMLINLELSSPHVEPKSIKTRTHLHDTSLRQKIEG